MRTRNGRIRYGGSRYGGSRFQRGGLFGLTGTKGSFTAPTISLTPQARANIEAAKKSAAKGWGAVKKSSGKLWGSLASGLGSAGRFARSSFGDIRSAAGNVGSAVKGSVVQSQIGRLHSKMEKSWFNPNTLTGYERNLIKNNPGVFKDVQEKVPEDIQPLISTGGRYRRSSRKSRKSHSRRRRTRKSRRSRRKSRRKSLSRRRRSRRSSRKSHRRSHRRRSRSYKKSHRRRSRH